MFDNVAQCRGNVSLFQEGSDKERNSTTKVRTINKRTEKNVSPSVGSLPAKKYGDDERRFGGGLFLPSAKIRRDREKEMAEGVASVRSDDTENTKNR